MRVHAKESKGGGNHPQEHVMEQWEDVPWLMRFRKSVIEKMWCCYAACFRNVLSTLHPAMPVDQAHQLRQANCCNSF